METIKVLSDFDELIKKDKVVAYFYADWCGPCKMLDIILEDIESENQDVTFVKVDADRFRKICKDYRVLNVPVLIMFSNSKVIKEQSGLMRREEVLSFLND